MAQPAVGARDRGASLDERLGTRNKREFVREQQVAGEIANPNQFRSVDVCVNAMKTAANIQKMKRDWQKKKDRMEQQKREAASNDIDEWEIPLEVDTKSSEGH